MASAQVLRMVQALSDAGFTGPALVTMTALGISESGGDPNVLNNTPSTGDYSVGAFQINYYNGLRASRTAEFGTPEALRGDIDAQARAAFKLSSGGKTFGPWQGDWSNGAYYRNLPAATSAVQAFQGGATAPGAIGSASGGSVASQSTTAINLASSSPSSDGCLLSFPGIPLPSVGPIGGGSIGGGCILTKTQGRHILGGLSILGGILIGALGIVMVVKEESNPGKAIGGLNLKAPGKAPAKADGIISDKEYDKRAGGKTSSELKSDSDELKKHKRIADRRQTFDAKTGKNHLGETREEAALPMEDF